MIPPHATTQPLLFPLTRAHCRQGPHFLAPHRLALVPVHQQQLLDEHDSQNGAAVAGAVHRDARVACQMGRKGREGVACQAGCEVQEARVQRAAPGPASHRG